MHREISHTDQAFHREKNVSLYLLTAVIGALMAIDLWPAFTHWLASYGIIIRSWPREISGYRLAFLPAILGGLRVLYNSLDRLLEGRLGADLAIAIACVAAILIGEPLVAAEIVFIGMLGECLECFTFERAQRAIRRVVEIFPRRSWVLRDGQEVRVFTADLQVGDQVVVKPGGRVPVDGVILSGRSTLDQSGLTGESLPADRGPGEQVLAGSLNQLGTIVIEAQRVAQLTVAGQVIELTAKSLKDKASLERTADRLARYFLPVVLGLAALTFLGSLLIRSIGHGAASGSLGYAAVAQSVYPALSVLVVACPCALILATPATLIAALGRLAGSGVLVKGGSALERLASVNAFAFDKTGTLTEGRFEVSDILPLAEATPDEILRFAATAEQQSEHVIAGAIIECAARRGLTLDPVDEFLPHPGAGVKVKALDNEIVVGNRRVLQDHGIALSSPAQSIAEHLDAGGRTTLWVARNREIVGAIGLRDRIRPEAAGVVEELRILGVRNIHMVTGDRPAVAKSVADQVHISDVHADLLPAEKADLIENWQKEHVVAMVGDGINDAPALARARVGLAVGATATDLAAEAGDIILMGDPLRPLPLLLKVSRETVRTIRQNILIFAFGVNAVGIVATAWLWPMLAPTALWYEQGPLAAVIYHQLGSVAVLLNAMRLLWFERVPATPSMRPSDGKLRTLDAWLAQRLDMHAFGHWLQDHARSVVVCAAALAILLYALSGLTQIGPDEQAVVTRFGNPVDDLHPGLYWRWPWPVEEVLRVRPARIHSVEIGFRSSLEPSSRRPSLAWESLHMSVDLEDLANEAVLITGDGNLVEIQATVRYVVADPRAYLSGALDHEGVLHAVTESALRETVASQSFSELLTTDRDHFQQQVEDRIRELCGRYPALGIKLDGLSVHDLHPPQDVVPAYHDVTKAMETRDRRVNEARAAALARTTTAETEAKQLVRQAEATKNQTVALAAAERDSFLARWLARTQLRGSEEWRFFSEALLELRSGKQSEAISQDYEAKRGIQLQLYAALTDFRLFWDALARGLAGREKILIDTDQVPGHRHLFLVDPEKFQPPPAILNVPENRPKRDSQSMPNRDPSESN
jgi:Cu+-exporting ATPase